MTSLAQLRLDDGDAERARSTIAELLRSIPTEHLLDRVDALAVAVAAGVAAGSLDEARVASAELRSIATRVGALAFHAHADAAAARLATERAAVEHWQDAARRFDGAGLAFDEADARLGLARALRDVGDDAGAREQESSAAAVLKPLRGGHGAVPAAAYPLTERQVEVLRLLARGLSNAEIAADLHLSEHTVHRHVANIYDALDLGSRAAAAAYAVRHGLG